MPDREGKKPFFLVVATGLLGVFASVGTLAMVAVGVMFWVGNGPYSFNGQPISKREFLGYLTPFGALFGLGCLLAGLAAWSIYTEKPTSRPQLIGFVLLSSLSALVVPAGPDAPASLVDGLAPWLLILGAAWIYLYRLPNVVAYYDTLAKRPRP